MSTWGSDPTESTYITNHNPQSTFTRSNWNGGMSLRPESVRRGSTVAAIRVGTFPSLRGQYPGTSPRPATSLITPQTKTLNQVPYSHREDSLAEKPKKEREEHKIPFVCPYQEHIEPHRLRQAIWTKEDGIIQEPVIAYQRCKSIGKHLTSSLAGTDKSRPRAALRLLSSFPTLT